MIRNEDRACVHSTAIVEEGAKVGGRTKIWHFAHVRTGAVIGEDCVIGKDCYIDEGVVIGDRVHIQNGVSVYKGVRLGDDVFVGPHVAFTNDPWPRVGKEWHAYLTNVENGASIGANATIVCGHTIGCGAMVGAGAVVVHDVPPHTLAVGNPAKIVNWELTR